MATISELVVKITGDSSGLQTALSTAESRMEDMGVSGGKLSKILGAGGLAVAFKLAADAADECIRAFAEAEVAELRFNAAAEASNRITAEGADKLKDFAAQFAALAGEDDDAILGMEAMLIATGRTREEIEKMLPAALGLANATGTTLEGAITQLNQTFSGTTGRLGRTTPELNKLTKEALANGAAVDVMLKKYGGLSTALSGSTKTSIANFNTEFGNLKENVGAATEQGIRPFRDALTGLLRQMNDETSGISRFAGGFNSVVEVFKELGLSLIGKGDVLQAVADAISQVEQKTRILLQTYGSVQDSAQRRASAEKEVGAAAAAAAKTASDAWAEAEKKIIEGRKDATKAYTDSLAEIDTRVQLGLMTEQEAAEAKYKANRELMDRLISLGYTGAETSKQIGDQTLREALARNESLYNDTAEGMEKIGKLYAQLAETRSSQEKKGQDEAVLTTQVLAAEDAARVETAAAGATDRTAYEQEYADAVAGMAKDLKNQAILNAAALAAEEAALTMSVKKEVTDRTALEYEAYTTVVGYMSNMVDGYSAAAAAKTAAEEAHTVAVQAEVTSQDALISEQVAAVVGYSEKITDAYAVAAEKKTGFEEGFTQAVATETASQTALQDEAVQTQIGYAKELSGANYDAAKETKAGWLAAADDMQQANEALKKSEEKALKERKEAYDKFSKDVQFAAGELTKIGKAFLDVIDNTAKRESETISDAIDEIKSKHELERKEINETADAAKRAANEKLEADIKSVAAATNAKLKTLDDQEEAELRKLGVLTEEEKLRKRVTDAKTVEEKKDAENELAIYLAKQKYADLRAEIEKTAKDEIQKIKDDAKTAEQKADADKLIMLKENADKEKAAVLDLERKKAKIKYDADTAQYETNMVMAVANAAAAIVQAFAQLGPIAGAIASLVVAGTTAAQIAIMTANKPSMPSFAEGGDAPGGMALVGEEGPELVQLPRGAHVFTNEESQQIASGGRNLTVNFYSPTALDPIEMRREFERLDRQLSFEGAF